MSRMTKRRSKPKRKASPIRTVMIENPDWRPDRDGEPGFPRMIPAAMDTAESAVETLYARGVLALAQKRAADRVRELWENAGGKMSGLDYERDRVDGGKGDPVTGRLHAVQELKRVRQLLGLRGFEMIKAVCAEGKALSEITPHKRERLTMADNLRADLDDLSAMWGLSTRRKAG